MRRYTIPLFAFLVGSLLIAGIYFGILTWAQGWDSALAIFQPNRWFVIPIWISFGIQAALYSILRFRLFLSTTSTANTGAVMGTSGARNPTLTVQALAWRAAHRILEQNFGQKPEGSFSLVVKGDPGSAQSLIAPTRAAATRAAAELETGKLADVRPVSGDVVSARIISQLQPADAKGYTERMREAATFS